MAFKTIFSNIVGPGKTLFHIPPSRGSLAGDILIRILDLDELVKSQNAPVIVIPVTTGIQENQTRRGGRLPLSRELRTWRLFTRPSTLECERKNIVGIFSVTLF